MSVDSGFLAFQVSELQWEKREKMTIDKRIESVDGVTQVPSDAHCQESQVPSQGPTPQS